MNSLARRLPAAASTGRARPSLPTRLPFRAAGRPERRRIAPTVVCDRPVAVATVRSDHCGWFARIRRAAASRSARESGSPCLMLASTARRKASPSSPSKKVTAIVFSPRSSAARTRCIPSITRIVLRCTRIGGRFRAAASNSTCSGFSPVSRGESAGSSEEIGTFCAGITSSAELFFVALASTLLHMRSFTCRKVGLSA